MNREMQGRGSGGSTVHFPRCVGRLQKSGCRLNHHRATHRDLAAAPEERRCQADVACHHTSPSPRPRISSAIPSRAVPPLAFSTTKALSALNNIAAARPILDDAPVTMATQSCNIPTTGRLEWWPWHTNHRMARPPDSCGRILHASTTARTAPSIHGQRLRPGHSPCISTPSTRPALRRAVSAWRRGWQASGVPPARCTHAAVEAASTL